MIKNILSRYYFLLVSLLMHASICEDHLFNFDPLKPNISTTTIPSELYGSIVENMPICCVDIFLYNPKMDSYLVVLRKQKPANNSYFYPGGRLIKGESFFDCAIRKCHQELGIEVVPHTFLGCYATLFPDSEWNCPTHTVNCVIFATTEQQELILDNNHTTYRWLPRDASPENDYLATVHSEALAYIKQCYR